MPDELSRFVSFVNAPEVADPTVTFTQKVGAQGADADRYAGRCGVWPDDDSAQRRSVWTTACAYDFLLPCRGVGVLLPDGAQAALFRLDDGTLHAVGNIDPFSGAAVMSRGIVGNRQGRATVPESPLKKAGVRPRRRRVSGQPRRLPARLRDARDRRRKRRNRRVANRLSGVGKDGGEHPRCGLAENYGCRVTDRHRLAPCAVHADL